MSAPFNPTEKFKAEVARILHCDAIDLKLIRNAALNGALSCDAEKYAELKFDFSTEQELEGFFLARALMREIPSWLLCVYLADALEDLAAMSWRAPEDRREETTFKFWYKLTRMRCEWLLDEDIPEIQPVVKFNILNFRDLENFNPQQVLKYNDFIQQVRRAGHNATQELVRQHELQTGMSAKEFLQSRLPGKGAARLNLDIKAFEKQMRRKGKKPLQSGSLAAKGKAKNPSLWSISDLEEELEGFERRKKSRDKKQGQKV